MRNRLIILMLFVILACGSTAAATFKFEFRKEIPLDRRTKLEINNIGGEIIIKGDPGSAVTIGATKIIEAESARTAEMISEAIDIDIKQHPDKISLNTRNLDRSSRSKSLWDLLFKKGKDRSLTVDFDINLPSETSLEINEPSGQVIISNINQKIYVNLGSGQLKIRSITGDVLIEGTEAAVSVGDVRGDLQVLTASSDVDVAAVTGQVYIKTTSGKKKIRDIVGSITIRQTSGSAEIEALDGYLHIQSGSGDINVRQNSGNFNLRSSSGKIHINSALATDEACRAETNSGDILLEIPKSGSAVLSLRTDGGKIESDIPVQADAFSSQHLTGQVGSGGPEISLITSTGNIILRQY